MCDRFRLCWLALAIEFGKQYSTIGYDLDAGRIHDLQSGFDKTNEISKKEFEDSQHLHFSNNINSIRDSNIYIVTVPTPIDENKNPDLTPLVSASNLVGSQLDRGDIVIFESTVYPGATEQVCLPILEEASGMKLNEDFGLGYSPERINPGDKNHKLSNILKVTSGSNHETAIFISNLYSSIIKAGTYMAESIQVAEAAKVIENTQRDLNIALINELSIIFNKLNIDTEQVLNAAETKWNFLPFRPGLVGGHCIGVDPYYLTYKAESEGYKPKVILSGRNINDGMGRRVANNMIEALKAKNISVNQSKVLIMGICFKENCPDIRNSKVVDVIEELKTNNVTVEVHDPWADRAKVSEEYGYELIEEFSKDYDGLILAVAHDQYKEMRVKDLRALGPDHMIIYDLKYLLANSESDLRL